MATFVQWHFQPAESKEGDIMMSILTRANTSNVKFLEKRLGEINIILKRIEKTKQLTQKNQTFVGELIKGINETMQKKTPKEKLKSWKVICVTHGRDKVESFEKQAKEILGEDFKNNVGVKLLEVLATKLEESNERKRKAKIHLKAAAHAVGKAQLKRESNERKRKAKIHLKMAAHAVGHHHARADDRFYELLGIFDDYFLKKMNNKYKKKVNKKYKKDSDLYWDDEEITLKYLEYYLEELFNLADITEPLLGTWLKNATRRADRNRIYAERKKLFKNFLKDERLDPYKSIRDKRRRKKNSEALKKRLTYKRKLMMNKKKRKLYGNEFFIFLVDLSFNRLEIREHGTVDELGEETDEAERYIDKSQFKSPDSWADDSTNANYLFYYINKAALKISHEYKEFDDKLIRWREKKK